MPYCQNKYLHHNLQTLVQLTSGDPTSVVLAIAMYMHLYLPQGQTCAAVNRSVALDEAKSE